MVEVRIGTRGDSLLLATDAPDLPISVTLESARLRAGTKPRDCFDLRGLPAYMADVAGTAMSEWVGPKTWESLEGDIRLVAGQAAGRDTITASLSLDPPTLIRRWWFRHSWGWSSSSVRVRAWGVRRCARLFHYRFLVGPGGGGWSTRGGGGWTEGGGVETVEFVLPGPAGG